MIRLGLQCSQHPYRCRVQVDNKADSSLPGTANSIHRQTPNSTAIVAVINTTIHSTTSKHH
jgi:hypothetical protein